MTEWLNLNWLDLESVRQFFYLIAFISTGVLFLRLLLLVFGVAGGEAATDAVDAADMADAVDAADAADAVDAVDAADAVDAVDATEAIDAVEAMDAAEAAEGGDAGMGLISFWSLTGFFVGFGWGGAATIDYTNSIPWALGVGIGLGLVLLYLVYSLMNFLFSLTQEGNIDFRNAVGESGTVYIPVPPKEEGKGQVQITVQGRMRVVPALNAGDQRLEQGQEVEVLRVLGSNTVVVRKLEVE